MPKLGPIGEAIKPVKKRDVVAEVFEAVRGVSGTRSAEASSEWGCLFLRNLPF